MAGGGGCGRLFRGAGTAAERPPAVAVLDTWYRLALELVRHMPTYSPPVASRAL
jgi:hypothetical protein